MNTIKSRLDSIEIKNRKNEFKHKIKRITRQGHKVINVSPFHFKEFEFNGNWHSENFEEEKFTNYIKGYGENTYYKILDELFCKLHSANYNLLDDFDLEENNYSKISEATKRLKRIIMKANNINDVEYIPEINELIPAIHLKEKEKRYKGIRLFVNISEDGYINLYLIDLYHLGIDAFNVATGKTELDRNYRSTKEYSKCISKVVDKYI